MLRLVFAALLIAAHLAAADRPRLLVLTDIGGDPDDQQAMIRLMVYANEFQIEGLIATASGTPGELKQAITQPQLIREIVNAYGQVRPNLARHADGTDQAKPVRPDGKALCVRCHAAKTGKPKRYPIVDIKEHAGAESCLTCHKPHDPRIG